MGTADAAVTVGIQKFKAGCCVRCVRHKQRASATPGQDDPDEGDREPPHQGLPQDPECVRVGVSRRGELCMSRLAALEYDAKQPRRFRATAPRAGLRTCSVCRWAAPG